MVQATIPELRVEAPDALTAVAERVRRVDPAAIAQTMRLVGLDAPGPSITIALVTEDHDIAQRTPRFVAGFAESEAGFIVIFPARSLSYPYDSLDDVVRHEIAHVLIARAAGSRPVPRWLHEGLALTAERAWGLEDRARVAFAFTAAGWSTRELADAFGQGGSHTTAAYALSGALVREMMRRYGDDAPARLLARLARGERFEEAFSATAGESLRVFEDRFWRLSWWAELVPFATSSVVLWFGVSLLGLYAIRTRRARDAARRRRWEEEDRAERERVRLEEERLRLERAERQCLANEWPAVDERRGSGEPGDVR